MEIAGETEGFVAALLNCSVERTVDLASQKYIGALFLHLTGQPVSKLVPDEDLVAWARMFNHVLKEVGPALRLQSRPDESGAEARFLAAVLFALEAGTRDEPDATDQALAIAAGTLDVDAALRARELARLTNEVAAAQQQLANAPPVTLDPELLAQIAAANRLVVGDVTVPVPNGARAEPETMHYTANAEGTIEITFITRQPVAELHALYTCWARSEGWLIEVNDDDAAAGGLRVAKGSRRFGIVMVPWGRETMLLFRLNRTPEATYQPAAAASTDAPPALPRVTRAYPSAFVDSGEPLSVDAMVCDRGLLFVSDRDRVRMIDPTTRTIRVVAGGEPGASHDESLAGAKGLACDADGLWVVVRNWGAIRRIDFARETISTLARELPVPRHIALADTTLYVSCELGELYSVDTRTGTTKQLLGENGLAQHRYGWSVEGLAIIGNTLYAVDGSGAVQAFDRTSGAVRKVAEAPRRACGITTDGHVLYVGCWGGMVRIQLGEKVVVEHIAGEHDFRSGNKDGPQEVAAVERPSHLAWDGTGGVYFIDDWKYVRWLDLQRRFVVTVM